MGDWLKFGDSAVAKFDETLVILPPTTQTDHALSLSFVIPAFVLATTIMNLTFEQTFTMVYEKKSNLVIIISAQLLSVPKSHTS